MWLLTTEGAYSIIQWHDGRMCVRARMPGDIARLRKLMPALGPESISPEKDYRYRAFVDRDGLAEGVANVARAITYGNFKSAVEKTSRPVAYKDALHRIWGVLGKLQPGGPYGSGGGAKVPMSKREQEAQTKATRSRAERRKAHVGKPCEDCGRKLPESQMDLFGGRWLCADALACRRATVAK